MSNSNVKLESVHPHRGNNIIIENDACRVHRKSNHEDTEFHIKHYCKHGHTLIEINKAKWVNQISLELSKLC